MILLTCITFFLLFSNVNVHFSNIKTLIWVAPPEHSIEAGNHFYIRVCYAERKTTLAWKRLEISHLRAPFSPPQPKHITKKGQKSTTAKTKPKLPSASTKKLSGNSEVTNWTSECSKGQTVNIPLKNNRYILLNPTDFYKFSNKFKRLVLRYQCRN